MLWLLLHPLVSLWCFLKAKQAGLRGWPWVLLALLTGPVSVPLFLNHRRMVYRKLGGRDAVCFLP
ncbi:hypothetical protein [Rheinheimera texasensis]|uniref:hypothetical protein n=1 Tax=Rheinheimera texasensis TaxID=306205 RepID=UPI0004E2484A|nr:hypothetical protein [Rheinheimera texasensis]